MKLDSKYFDSIRIKPDHLSARPELPVCDGPGCRLEGAYRAPKGRLREGEYFNFCLDHVREYNKSYNYFAGMPEEAITAYRVDAATGHRPTWTMGARRGRDRVDMGAAGLDDAFGMFGDFTARRTEASTPRQRPLKNLERRSFAVLDLEGDEQRHEIKARFKELVKRLHPDANGGDRSSEDRLRQIIQAYNHLRAAGFC
jgi:hypothetical protein